MTAWKSTYARRDVNEDEDELEIRVRRWKPIIWATRNQSRVPDLSESSSVLGSLQTVSLTKTCQIRTIIKKKRPLDTRKSFLNLAWEYVFQTFAHQPVFLTRRQDRAIILLEFRELVKMHKMRRSICMRFHISSRYESKACCVNILLLFSASIRCKRRTLFRWSMDESMSAIFQLTWP